MSSPNTSPPGSGPSPGSGASRAPGSDERFAALVAEADAVSVDGWDFSWLDGRATEQRPSWGYARAMADRMGRARAALDIQTGGGEVLASVPRLPPLTVATESWPPNVARATRLLHPRGAVVVADPDEPPLPFGDSAFDLVVSRHPVTTWWEEIVYFLRKVIWMVPGFTVEAHLPQLRSLHRAIESDGPFVAHSSRFLIEARKPR
ncbi:methyltransferase domain-containing protein [Streptomyces halstedii]|uniref:Class I SAM-dependent methyltransferase n=1 Tax=Streptomyces halstedii TaxID=1944 RepID=A0A6N9U5V2_STRHA|nr:methyltransferase domain-containing protein [Streptomyces halstedii]NEA17393.1 class I SAM-dependent methyltransferase [Streptomyces halstedii]